MIRNPADLGLARPRSGPRHAKMLATRECALLAMVRTRDIDPAITVRQAPGGDPQMAGPFTDQAFGRVSSGKPAALTALTIPNNGSR
jgi:hypothetical protein